MSQQINLLATKTSAATSAWAGLAVLALVLVSLLGAWGVRQGDLRSAQEAEAASAQQLRNAKTVLDAKTQRKEKDLGAEIVALRPQADGAQKFLAQMGELGNQKGYARYFAALTTVSEPGVWLSSVSVEKSGKTMRIRGHALRKESVMRYAQQLNALFADDGVQFTALELSPEVAGGQVEAKPQSSAVTFTLY